MKLKYISALPSKFRPKLETLMYFNPKQREFAPAILDAIEQFGEPQIIQSDEILRVQVAQHDAQGLFVLDCSGHTEQLVGVVIFTRTDEKTVLVLHIAVDENYSAAGSAQEKFLTLQILMRVREVARQLKGVNEIRLWYDKNYRKIPV